MTRGNIGSSGRAGGGRQLDIDAAYRGIEEKFHGCLERRSVDTDEYLLRSRRDTRRGLSLAFGPSDAIAENVEALQTELARYSGDQYKQPRTDLHTTILSVIPVARHYSRFARHLADCERAAESAIRRLSEPLEVRYRGVIASNECVLVRGYPETGALQSLRAEIIAELVRLGIEAELERRYAPVTAHMTIMRFVTQLQCTSKFCRLLERLSDVEVGFMRISRVELVENDWYMRRGTLSRVRTFPL